MNFRSTRVVALAAAAAIASFAAAQPSQIWSKRINRGWAPEMIGVDHQIGPDNTTYVIGLVSDQTVLAKFSDSGAMLWSKTLTGVHGFSSRMNDLAVDQAGNVVCVGNGSYPYDTQAMIVKVDSNGNELWRRFYTSAGQFHSFSQVALSNTGDIAVLGTRTQLMTYRKAPLYYYNSAGDLLWTDTIDDLIDRHEDPGAISFDTVGNVIDVVNSPMNGAMYVMKYSPAGSQTWRRTYDGAGQGADQARAIKIDSQNSIVIAGAFDLVPPVFPDPVIKDKLGLVKFDQNGSFQWVKLYGDNVTNNYGSYVQTDSADNVYAVGRIETGGVDNAALVKLNSAGTEQYVKHLEGDYAQGVGVDVNNNVYVLWPDGQSTLRKYDSAGGELWTLGFPAGEVFPKGLLTTQAGENFVLAQDFPTSTTERVRVHRVTNGGTALWESDDLVGIGSVDNAALMARDANSNTYLSGDSNSTGTIANMTSRVDGAGNLVWNKDAGVGSPVAIAADSTGVWVAGDGLAKLSADGVLLFRKNDLNSRHTTAMALDSEGNVYTAGWEMNKGTEDLRVCKYSPTGVLLWRQFFNGSGNGSDRGTCIALDNFGNVYAAGSMQNGSNTDFMIVKYTTAGGYKWAQSLAGPDGFDDVPTHLVVSAGGNVFMAGRMGTSASTSSAYLIKYLANSALAWQREFAPNGDRTQTITDLDVDGDGNIVFGGQYHEGSANGSMYLAKYSSGGNSVWTRVYTASSGAMDTLKDLTIAGDNSVYGTGAITYNGGLAYATIKYTTSGVRVWPASGGKYRAGAIIYVGTAQYYDVPIGIGRDADNTIYVGGTSLGLGSSRDFHVIKYSAG